jgi:hypothetical protein
MANVRVLTPTVRVDLKAEARGSGRRARGAGGKLRLGLLDNTKPNTGLLLKRVGEILAADGLATEVVSLDKVSSSPSNPASSPASADVLARLAEEADVVVTGLGN